MSLPRRKTMFPIMETMSKYGPSLYNGTATPDSVADSLEYIYVDDPKDGNDSSADDNKVKVKVKASERNSAYTTRSLVGFDSNNETKRAQSAKTLRSVVENDQEENVKSSDEDEAYFSLPWRLLPGKVLEDLEFYKNAGKFRWFISL